MPTVLGTRMRRPSGVVAALASAVVLSSGAAVAAPHQVGAHPRPDLRVTAVSVSAASVPRGKPVTVAVAVRNTGRAGAQSSTARIYLSKDTSLGTGDRLLGSVAVKALAKRQTVKVAKRVTVPVSIAVATYHLVVCADSLHRVRESNEHDNCRGTRTLKVTAPVPTTAPTQTSADLIDGDTSLDSDTKALYKVYADFADPRLPTKYRGLSDGEGTALVEASAQWASLSQTTRDALDPFYLPPFDRGSWYDQAKYGDRAGQRHRIGHSTQHSTGHRPRLETATPPGPGESLCASAGTADTTHWAYVDNGGFRVWYLKGDSAQEQKATHVASQMSNTILPRVTQIFRAPLLDDGSTKACRGGSDAIDVALADASLLPSGRSVAQGWGTDDCATPQPGFLLVNSTYTGSFLDATLVHETTHLANYAYKWVSGCVAGSWLTEATATWMEDYVFGKTYQPEQEQAARYLELPQLAIDDHGSDNERQYGAYLFPFFLAHDVSPTIMGGVWKDQETYSPTAAFQVALQSQGTNLEQEWPRFVLDNWNQDPRTDYQKWDGLTTQVTPARGFDGSVPVRAPQTIPLPVHLPHLSSQTYVFNIDDSVRSVEFDNTLVGVDGNDVQALEKLEDGTWKPFAAGSDIWTNRSKISFCRTEPDQDISELVVMVANTSFLPATTVAGTPKLVTKPSCECPSAAPATSGTVLSRDEGDCTAAVTFTRKDTATGPSGKYEDDQTGGVDLDLRADPDVEDEYDLVGRTSSYSFHEELHGSGTTADGCGYTSDAITDGSGAIDSPANGSQDGDVQALEQHPNLLLINLSLDATQVDDEAESGTSTGGTACTYSNSTTSDEQVDMPPCPYTDPSQPVDPYYTFTPGGDANTYQFSCSTIADFQDNGDEYHHHIVTTVSGTITLSK